MENLQRKKNNLSVRENLHVPVDLLIDIFSRVPAKSIARFHCVSKLWGSILRRPDFTELFLTKSLTRPGILFSFKLNGKIFFFSSPQRLNPNESSSLVATRYKTPFLSDVSLSDFCVNNGVCGFVCHEGNWERKTHMICNPATGDLLALPRVSNSIERFYFGYDPINKQCKVLCMTSSNTHWVLTLENGKRLWRLIECEFHFKRDYIIHDDICINGVVYFLARTQGSCVIVCFDVTSEKFYVVNVDNLNQYTPHWLILINYNGKFGIHRSTENIMYFDLWVLEDARNHKWSKHVYGMPSSLKQFVENNKLHIVGRTSTGEMVFTQFWLSDPFYVFYYNFERNTFTRVHIQGFEKFQDYGSLRIHTFLDYTESMILLK